MSAREEASIIEPPGTQPACEPSVFDALRPPSTQLIDDCVHCGFCLPACPTYLLEGNEANSPRGRIALMQLGAAGEVAMDTAFVDTMDACLGCMACVTACPSGVEYDKLIEAVRPQIERQWERTRADRLLRALIFGVFPYPTRLRVLAVLGALYQRARGHALLTRAGALDRLPPGVRALEALLPEVTVRQVLSRPTARTPAAGPVRRRVGLLTGCVQQVLFGEVNAATARVLAAEGCEVVAPPAQQCCGALSGHAGREPEAQARARRLIDVFEQAGVDTVAVNVAGCGSAMKQYGRLLRDDPAYAERAAAFSARVRDVSELLHELGPVAPRHPIQARVAYHDACHLAHAQGVRAQPRAVLRTIPGLTVTDVDEAELCCGSAGIYNLVQAEPAERLGRRKAEHVEATDPDAVVTANAGCLLQIRRYLDRDAPVLHPVQLLDASLRGIDPISRRPER